MVVTTYVQVTDKFHNRFISKWRSEFGSYAGYLNLTNTTPAVSDRLYIGGGEHYYPTPKYIESFKYKPEKILSNYPLKIDGVKLTTDSLRYANGIVRCPLTISDVESPTVVVNDGFSFRVLYPSVLLLYVFTNKPKNWEVPQDNVP